LYAVDIASGAIRQLTFERRSVGGEVDRHGLAARRRTAATRPSPMRHASARRRW
jgi:hypothetical protein